MIIRSLPCLLFLAGLTLFSIPATGTQDETVMNASEVKQTPIKASAYLQQYALTFLNQTLLKQYPPEENFKLEITVGEMDSRLTITPCQKPPHVKFLTKKHVGRPSVNISCQYPTAWNFIVPSTVKLFHPVVINTQVIGKGQMIDDAMLSIMELDVATLHHGYFTSTAELAGYAARSSINLHSVISPRNLIKPKIVFKGDKVTLLVKRGAISVRMSGIALADGREGKQIRVKNQSSARIVKGTVLGPGLVRVLL